MIALQTGMILLAATTNVEVSAAPNLASALQPTLAVMELACHTLNVILTL